MSLYHLKSPPRGVPFSIIMSRRSPSDTREHGVSVYVPEGDFYCSPLLLASFISKVCSLFQRHSGPRPWLYPVVWVLPGGLEMSLPISSPDSTDKCPHSYSPKFWKHQGRSRIPRFEQAKCAVMGDFSCLLTHCWREGRIWLSPARCLEEWQDAQCSSPTETMKEWVGNSTELGHGRHKLPLADAGYSRKDREGES